MSRVSGEPRGASRTKHSEGGVCVVVRVLFPGVLARCGALRGTSVAARCFLRESCSLVFYRSPWHQRDCESSVF
jgi:hypothetical protein